MTPSRARGRRDRATLPQAKEPQHGTAAANAEGQEPPGMALPASYTGTAGSARATLTRRGGGGAYAAGARAHTHTTDTWRGPEGQPDRASGSHRRHGMAYRQAKRRDTWAGREGRKEPRVRCKNGPGGAGNPGDHALVERHSG